MVHARSKVLRVAGLALGALMLVMDPGAAARADEDKEERMEKEGWAVFEMEELED